MIMTLFSLKQVQHEEKMLINVDNPDQVSPDSVTVSGGESVYLAQVLLNNLITWFQNCNNHQHSCQDDES